MSRVCRAAGAGALAALAYLAEQAVDRRVANPRSDDLILLGGLVSGSSSVWRPLGLALHVLVGILFGVVFERVAAPLLRGPYWLRGLVVAQVENLALWPLILILDRVHPAIRQGALAPLNRRVYFAQEVLRHAAFGAVLGLLLGQPTTRPRA